MSDSEQDQQVTEQQQDQQENQDQQEDQDEDEDEDDQQQDSQQQDDDQQQGSGQQDQQQQQQQDQQASQSEKNAQKLPSFKPVNVSPQFKFTSLLSEIASLGNSVDNFITTLPSRGGSGSFYRSSYHQPRQQSFLYNKSNLELPQQSKVIIMKDQDCQVSMQPQIVIQPTIKQEQPKKQPYKISNQSTKFLAQLYQENKKLKRWQNSGSSYNPTNSYTSAYGNSRDKFERKQYEKGIFNVEDRNKQIDQAIQALRIQDDYQ